MALKAKRVGETQEVKQEVVVEEVNAGKVEGAGEVAVVEESTTTALAQRPEPVGVIYKINQYTNGSEINEVAKLNAEFTGIKVFTNNINFLRLDNVSGSLYDRDNDVEYNNDNVLRAKVVLAEQYYQFYDEEIGKMLKVPAPKPRDTEKLHAELLARYGAPADPAVRTLMEAQGKVFLDEETVKKYTPDQFSFRIELYLIKLQNDNEPETHYILNLPPASAVHFKTQYLPKLTRAGYVIRDVVTELTLSKQRGKFNAFHRVEFSAIYDLKKNEEINPPVSTL